MISLIKLIMKKVVVTGSEGFIGKVLCRKIEALGAEVVRIDRCLGIEALRIGEFLDGVDAVFHLAAQTSVFNDNLQQIAHDNIATFVEVVEQCNRHGIPLVYASSSTANEGNTTSLYGLSKRFDEEFASIYAKNATGVRLHNVYGPNQRPGTLLHYLMTRDKVTLFNNGENIRCFTYVDDAVDGLIGALECGKPLVNVVNYEPVRIEDFSKEVAKYNGVELIMSPETRDRDNVRQDVDRNMFTIPIRYRNYRVGIQQVFTYGKED